MARLMTRSAAAVTSAVAVASAAATVGTAARAIAAVAVAVASVAVGHHLPQKTIFFRGCRRCRYSAGVLRPRPPLLPVPPCQ